MRLLDRYLLRELLVPLGFCLGGFLVFWMGFDILGELDGFQRAHMRVSDVALYYWYGLPELLVTVLPVGFLLALLYALTSHARHNELTAIRAAGIGLWRLCLPYFALGTLFSVGLYALNERIAPDARDHQEALKQRRLAERTGDARQWRERIDVENAAEGRLWNIGAFNVATAELRAPRVRLPLDPGARRTYRARLIRWGEGGWRATNVAESLWRRADDPAPISVVASSRDFPRLPGSPDDLLRWPGTAFNVPTPVTVTNPGAKLGVVVVTNVAWRTNIVVPAGNGLRWRVGAYDPLRRELHDVRVEVEVPRGAVRQVVGESGGWEDGKWVFRKAVEYVFRSATDGDPMQVLHESLVVPELAETPDMIRAEIKVLSQRRGRALRRPELTLREIADYRRLHDRIPPELDAMLDTTFHARLAAPWTCLVVALIAVPFSAPSGRRNLFYGVAGSIGIAFAYFVLQRFGFALGQSGQVPGWVAAWLPNTVFGATGAFLISRVP